MAGQHHPAAYNRVHSSGERLRDMPGSSDIQTTLYSDRLCQPLQRQHGQEGRKRFIECEHNQESDR